MKQYVLDEERARELKVRTVDCPVCGAVAGKACVMGFSSNGSVQRGQIGHLGRYNAAARAGLVPPLAGAS